MPGLNAYAAEFFPAGEMFADMKEMFADMDEIEALLDKEDALAAEEALAAEDAIEAAEDAKEAKFLNKIWEAQEAEKSASRPAQPVNPRAAAFAEASGASGFFSRPQASATTPCRYGSDCTRPGCWFSHPTAQAVAPTTAPEGCRWGDKCFGKKSGKCPFQH